MHGMAVQFGGKLDAAHQFDSGLARQRQRAVVTGEGVVVRNSEHLDAGLPRLFHQLGGREGPVGFVGVRVQIDQRSWLPDVPV